KIQSCIQSFSVTSTIESAVLHHDVAIIPSRKRVGADHVQGAARAALNGGVNRPQIASCPGCTRIATKEGVITRARHYWEDHITIGTVQCASNIRNRQAYTRADSDRMVGRNLTTDVGVAERQLADGGFGRDRDVRRS